MNVRKNETIEEVRKKREEQPYPEQRKKPNERNIITYASRQDEHLR